MPELDRRAELVVENFRSWLPMLAHVPGARFDERHGVTAWTSDTPLPVFNGLWGAPPDVAVIDDLLEPLGGRPLIWLVPPPADIDLELEQRGFDVERVPGMAVDLASLPQLATPPGVAVAEVDDDPEQLAVATTIAFTSNGFPELATEPVLAMLAALPDRTKFRTFLATVDGVPAAASALVVSGNVAGLYNVGTAGAFRRRGLGTLVSLAALRAGQARGCELGVLEATPDGESIYRSLGFEECCRFTFATRA
ncbi:MAG: GNAT family N-acetyltransferase [Gaiellaceae bacterium]